MVRTVNNAANFPPFYSKVEGEGRGYLRFKPHRMQTVIANMIFIIFGALIAVSPIYGHEQVVSQSQTSNEQVMNKS